MQFERLLKIISKDQFEKIKTLNVLIVGIGGVGGYALESLTRSGVSNITIIDNDNVDITNLNRQIIALHSTIDKSKVDVAKERVLDINPDINIRIIKEFLTKDNINEILEQYDYIIDACDTITTKVGLIKYAKENNIKIISCMGTGNRFDPTKLTITKLNKTSNDPLAKVMRNLLRKEALDLKVPVVWSSELPIKTHDNTPGSIVLVPMVAGCLLASFVINDCLNN